MIKGAPQAFKFTTSYNFDDLNNIIAEFSQPHNTSANLAAPMPIRKYYNKKFEPVTGEWSTTDKDNKKVYKIDAKYGRYDSSAESPNFVWSATLPTESNLLGTNPSSVPTVNSDGDISKIYKYNKSYYQYNPNTQKWDITESAPSTDLIELSQVGVNNIPNETNKKQACVYKDHYYRYNGTAWESSSDAILPIQEVDYWDNDSDKPYDTQKTYCAEETYYKYINGAWRTYGRDCVYPIEVCAWNSDDTSEYDISKIYMLKELYYTYNPTTDKFEKTAVREVYYKYNITEGKWEECAKPDIQVEEIALWVNEDAENSVYDVNKTYVCKHVYYNYNASTKTWDGSNNMLIPVVVINSWVDADYHDSSKVYMCPERFYQYNIEEEAWEEVNEVKQPQTIELDYWTDPTDRDKSNIYLCGPTYFQYDSTEEKWVSSTSYEMKLTKIDNVSEAIDRSKIYECTPTYYKYNTIDNEWVSCKNMTDAFRNDGFQPVDGDPKSFLMVLNADETMRFTDKYKGRAQVTVYSDTSGLPESSKIEYFMVYPTLITETFGVTATSDTEVLRVLDAGDIIEE